MSVSLKQFGFAAAPTEHQVRGAGVWAWARQAWQVFATRRQLAMLDDRSLADLGISRAQARWEAGRAFWDLHGVLHRR